MDSQNPKRNFSTIQTIKSQKEKKKKRKKEQPQNHLENNV